MSWIGNLLSGKPSKEKFGAIVNKHLAENGITGKFQYDANDFAIKVVAEDGGVQSYYLANAYDDYCRAPSDARRNVLDAYFTGRTEIPESLHDAITAIFPRLQIRSFYEMAEQRQKLDNDEKAGQDSMPRKLMADWYAIGMIYDTDKHVSFFPSSQLEKWGTTFEQLYERALTNLERITPDPFQRPFEGVYVSQYEDTHDATRMLLTHRVTECRVKGRPLAAVPNRSRLVIVGEDDFAAQEKMLNLVDHALKEEPRPLPVFMLVFDGTQWKLWDAPEGNPNKARFEMMRYLALNDEYGAQKEMLDALNAKEGRDVFVATYFVFQNEKTKQLRSVGTLTEGVPTVMPRADQMAFVRPEKDSCMVKWDDAAAVLGSRLSRVEGVFPERWFVDYFPNEEELQRLRAMDVGS